MGKVLARLSLPNGVDDLSYEDIVLLCRWLRYHAKNMKAEAYEGQYPKGWRAELKRERVKKPGKAGRKA